MGISRIYQIPVNELLRLNKLKIRSNIHAGQKIIITAKTESPAQKITVHIVKKNDTLSSISRYYKISMQNIKSNNKIYNDKLFIGQRLFIPVKDDKVHLTEYNFSWPVSGRVVAGFGMHNRIPHKGIDIAAEKDTPVKVSLPGEIRYVGYLNSLKNFIIVKHDSDITTVYGNLGETLVNIDQKVEEGEVIGKITTEENSSISFLHFEIRINASPRDPLSYLTKKY